LYLKHHSLLWKAVLYFVPSALLMIIGLLLFTSAGRDDAHITYWPAYTLAHFGEMVNYNGVRVEQSSSLLHVVSLALLSKISGIEMVTLGKISSIVFGMISVALTGNLVTKVLADRTLGFAAAISTATYPFFIYWSYGGLETTLTAFTGILLILSIGNYWIEQKLPRLFLATLVIILFELTRPETPILLGCLLVGAGFAIFLQQRINGKTGMGKLSPMLKLFGFYVLSTVGIFLFRLWYFGELFPQPVSAKSNGIHFTSIMKGLLYIKGNFLDGGLPMIFLSAIMAVSFLLVLGKQFRKEGFNIYSTLSLLYVAGYMAFAILVGGDWMEGGRFLVPFIPVAISMAPIMLGGVVRDKLPLTLLILLLVGIEIKATLDFTKQHSTGTPLWSQIKTSRNYDDSKYSWFEKRNRVNRRDVYIIDYLDYLVPQIARLHKPVTILSAQMGMVPYHISQTHFGEIQFIDRAGLIDRTFTDCESTQKNSKDGIWKGVSYTYFFENFSEIEKTCKIAWPDIIYDISVSDLTKELLENNGYTILYMQTGNVTSNEKWLEGYTVKGRHILGVHSEILNFIESDPVFIRLKE